MDLTANACLYAKFDTAQTNDTISLSSFRTYEFLPESAVKDKPPVTTFTHTTQTSNQ
jgi:hypothetical protein